MLRDGGFVEPRCSYTRDASHEQAIGVNVVVNELHAAYRSGQGCSGRYDVQFTTGSQTVETERIPSTEDERRSRCADTLPACNCGEYAAHSGGDEINLTNAEAVNICGRNCSSTGRRVDRACRQRNRDEYLRAFHLQN